ncbi:MAG: DoxX family protein [Salibacteraceae bacterium]
MQFNKENISRILVGALFIISGLIKANDPLGFSYKLEEYFAFDVLNWTIFQGSEVFLASFISIGEIVLGAALIAGEKIKLSAWLLLIMMIFFTFLTGYTAIGNWFFEHPEREFTHTMESLFGFVARDIHYFKDCGCFGDAIPFTPWDSFVKDIVLFVFTIIIFKGRNKISPNSQIQDVWYYSIAFILISAFSIGMTNWVFPIVFILILFAGMLIIKKKIGDNGGWFMGAFAFLLTALFPIYVVMYLPVKDFRPFAIGENILHNMELQEGEEPPLYTVDYTMKSKTTGQESIVSAIDYMAKEIWKDTDLEIVSTGDQYLFKDGVVPPIHDFVLETNDGEDLTYSILSEKKVFLWIAYDLDFTNEGAQIQVKKIIDGCLQDGIPVYVLSASGFEDSQNFKQIHNLDVEFLTCDATTLKTVIRSNPGLVILEEGVVKEKIPFRRVGDYSTLKNDIK